MHRVALHQMDNEGFIAIVARWEAGQGKRTAGMSIVVPEPDETTDTDPAVVDAETETEIQAAVAADEDETYTAYCVKCKQKREFHGHVEETANGRRMAKGTCPVCGTKVNAILKNIPLSEDFHTPDDEPDEDAEAFAQLLPGVTLRDDPSAEDVEAENAEMPLTDPQTGDVLDETLAIPVVEFSEAPKPKPAKRTRKTIVKVNGNSVETEAARVAALKVALCPQCETKQPVQQKAGLDIIMPHPNVAKHLDRCAGSSTVVS
jgi:ssDNA-binding Zn-finger/Zn-ribbon topoisomerase 1